jgi:glycosyltransferase involved in cell wall biosynthesis
MVTTIHGFSSPKILPIFKAYEDQVSYVAISHADRHPDLRYGAVIHHGAPVDDFPFDAVGSEDLLFFGRIHPHKGAWEAVEVARRTGRRLTMAGIVQDERYFKDKIEPAVDGEAVRYLGPVGGEPRTRALGSARALLHLISFNEPFGLSVIEAMACGTPVIAFDRGSMSELIKDGVTGFLVNTLDEAVEAVARVGELDRAACRRHVEANFSVDVMTDRYLALYAKILGRT